MARISAPFYPRTFLLLLWLDSRAVRQRAVTSVLRNTRFTGVPPRRIIVGVKTPTRNNGGLFRRTTATGLMLLFSLFALPSCATKHMPDWSRVQALPLQTKTEVQLYEDEAPQESRKVRGRFDSATANSVTLTLEDGQTRTLPKASVRKVLTRRPFWSRWPGWLALGVGLGASQMWSAVSGVSSDHPNALFYIAHTAPAVPFFLLSGMGGIYEVSPQHRKQTQGVKQSGAQDEAPEKPEDPRRD